MSFDALPTAAIADACVRLAVAERVLPLRPVIPGRIAAGRVLPACHAGSVDVFFEAFQAAKAGDVLVIDNDGRLDEGCIGDLTALEAMHHKVGGIAVDGCHRDTAALRSLDFPVWSRGASPFGPRTARARKLDALGRAAVGGFEVTAEDVVALDDDGAVFVPQQEAARVWELAARMQRTEAEQARRAQAGEPLCEQFDVAAFLTARKTEPGLTFRAHLRKLGKAIEE